MPVIVVTRLRVREASFDDEFFALAVASLVQAQASAGNFGADTLADENDVWWTVSSWSDRAAMHAFVTSEPHHSTMRSLDHLCDEASFVDWDTEDPAIPDWQMSHRRLTEGGTAARLTHPTPEHATLAFPLPVPRS